MNRKPWSPLGEQSPHLPLEDHAIRTPSSLDQEVARIQQELAVEEGESYTGPARKSFVKPEPLARKATSKSPPAAPSTTSTTTLPPQLEQLRELANQGDAASLAALQQLLDENPENWQRLGDLASTAEKLLFQRVAGSDRLAIESLHRKANALREELTPADPTPLETLAIQRVIACWMQMQYLDAVEASTPQWTPSQATQWARRQESAERRYQVAVKSLGLAQRLRKMSRREPATPSNVGNGKIASADS